MRKIKTRIKPHIAEALGLDVNPSGQYRVSEELYNKSVQLKAEEKIKKVTTVTKQNEYFTEVTGCHPPGIATRVNFTPYRNIAGVII
jgi:hypothetical protein